MIQGLIANRYQIIEKIGHGGAAQVFKAMDTRLDRLVALKVLHDNHSQASTFTQRFENEARIVARLSHPNLVEIYDADHVDGQYFIVMAYVPGVTLKEYLAGRPPLSEHESREIITQVLQGLAVVHDAGLVHRDMKPQNVLMAPDGRVKITDFGLAKVLGQAGITQAGLAFGTPHYLSPEQAFGEEVTLRADLYAVGVMLYEMLSGCLPFDSSSSIRIAYAHLFDEPQPLEDVAPGLTPEMVTVVQRAMRKDPAERFQDTHDMLAALARVPEVEVEPMSVAAADADDGRPGTAALELGPAPGFVVAPATKTMPTRRSGSLRLSVLLPLLLLALLGVGALAGSILSREERDNPEVPGGTATGGSQAVVPATTGTATQSQVLPPGGTVSAAVTQTVSLTISPEGTVQVPGGQPSPTASPTSPLSTPTPSRPTVLRYAISTQGAPVSVYSEPRPDSGLVTTVPYGVPVQADARPVLGANGTEWYRVTYGAHQGYIRGTLLASREPVARPTARPPATVAPQPTGTPTPIVAGTERVIIELDSNSFVGGLTGDDGTYRGRTAQRLLARGTQYSRTRAIFRIERTPLGDSSGEAGFALVGMDSADERKTRILIEINGKPVYHGLNALDDDNPSGGSANWDQTALTFPVTNLVRGENQITISNMEPGSEEDSPPWFVLDRVLVVYYK